MMEKTDTGAGREVFVVDDDPAVCRLLASVLKRAGFGTVVFSKGGDALEALPGHDPSAVILDVILPDMNGEELLLKLRAHRPDMPVIMLSTQESVERAVGIMKLVPFDYFVKPFDHERMVHSVARAAREHDLQARVRRLEREVQENYAFDEIVGGAPAMRQLYDQIHQVLDNRITVFITGESGTGKELVAKAIHYNGSRRSGPFVALNCGAIPESLQESELFGHEKGAFTGAVSTHRGKFEQAHGGTLFLDEIGELTPAVQTRLLRVIQESEVQRVGGTRSVPVDIRFIAATHRDLEEMVRDGSFREDLYYRMVVFPIEIPPLRQRREDVPLLADHFLRKHRRQAGGRAEHFDADALDVLCRYEWPGNVRELENVVQRAIVTSRGDAVAVSDLPPKLVLRSMGLEGGASGELAGVPAAGDQIQTLEVMERKAIEHALLVLEGNVSLAARRLGVGRATLYRKLARYGLVKDADKRP